MRYVLTVLGGLMAVVGGVWVLQGVGLLPGSFMTGQTFWAVVGSLVFLAGGMLLFAGARQGARRR